MVKWGLWQFDILASSLWDGGTLFNLMVHLLQLTEYELCIASNLVDPQSMHTTWEDIGGMEETVEEIQEAVILPFTCQKILGGSLLLQPPKGRSGFPVINFLGRK